MLASILWTVLATVVLVVGAVLIAAAVPAPWHILLSFVWGYVVGTAVFYLIWEPYLWR